MSSPNLLLLERIYERWGKGDFTTEDLYDKDFTLSMSEDLPDSGIYTGVEATVAYMRAFLEPWRELTIEAEELIDGGHRVLARVLQTGTGATSGIEVELRYFQLWSFNGDRPAAMETIMQESEARAKLAR